MNQRDRSALAESRRLVGALRGLGTAADAPDLRAAVLTATGLADACFPLDSPIGRVFVAHNPQGIAAVAPAASAEAFADLFRARFGRAIYPADPPASLRRAIERHLRGERAALRFDLRGLSEFERATLLKALEVPRGEVRPYGWVAREIGRPRAVRAVGTALGHNPVPLLIPCHRIVRSDGHLGNYAFGPAAKEAALGAEGLVPAELEQLADEGIRYTGSDTTRIFCFPTCRHARRTTPQHRVAFASEARARAAGYRPCKVCRPALAS